ncbi:hypothetical protein [Bacillus haynesii]|uniref:hypothetical protein n=1 Tax=Bacillus haynesii TaxID=1925021 RepID=UPI00227DC062|nr:hypothetical protein [Bacillus haynesii]MCY8370133.1 hypothetical protein [Bacillus haynesii]MEC1420075.1 hypothetical protein [Bacillus haynesii]
MGGNRNRFDLLYAALAVFMAGFDAMKFGMAVLCGIGLLIAVTMIPVVVLIGAFGGYASALLGVASL